MKRVAVALIGLVMVTASAACQPTPTPPPLYQPPVLGSVQLSPQPAHPGEVVTIVAEVSDDEVVSSVTVHALIGPDGVTLPGAPTCTAAIEQHAELGHAAVTVSCPVPTFASNGAWQADITVYDKPGDPNGYFFPGLRTRLPFDVIGGVDDVSPPSLVSYRTDPAVVRQDTVFTLTVRLRDDAPPVELGSYSGTFSFLKVLAPNSFLACSEPVATPVSPTDTDVAVTCTPGDYNALGSAEVGPHRAVAPVRDALGHEGSVEMYVDVLAAVPGAG